MNKLLLVVSAAAALISPLPTQGQTTALVGGTVIDVSRFGHSDDDIEDAVVILEGDRISEVGPANSVIIPEGARVIDVQGKYIFPGLIDGFAAMDNQSFADAYLYMGVTSIVGVEGLRRDSLFINADPGPTVYPSGSVGKQHVTTPDLLREIDRLAENGVKFLLLMYELSPEQLKQGIGRAHERGMAAVGELGRTSYPQAVEFGIDAFVHTGRYAIELAPRDLRERVAANPFGPPAREFRMWLAGLSSESTVVQDYARLLGSTTVALLPTLGLYGAEFVLERNPWERPIASILDPADIHDPVEEATGRHLYPPEVRKRARGAFENLLEIEHQYHSAGARYLAGSGTDVNGTMPGISLHQELELLTRVGLSEREALAAATSNFAEQFPWGELGLIETGYRADLVVTNENPVEDIRNLEDIHLVVLRGDVLARSDILNRYGTASP